MPYGKKKQEKMISIKNSMNMLSSIICNFNSDFRKIFIMFGLQKNVLSTNKQKMTQFVSEKNKNKMQSTLTLLLIL